MQRVIIGLVVAILVLSVGALSQTSAQTNSGSEEEELIKLFHDWMDAEVKADMAFIERFVAEDCTMTDPVGNVWTRDQFLAGLKSGEGAVKSASIDNVKARVYGDAAVVTGRMTSTMMRQGREISGQYQCTDTLIKKAGRWQVVAVHLSMIPQK